MAMQNVFNILVDLKVAKTIPQLLVTQNDSVVFILEVMQDGVPFDLTDTTTVSLAHTRKDQTVVITPGTKVGNKATFALGTNETSVTGAVTAKAQFYDAEGRVSTLSFSYQVGLDPTGSGYVPSTSEATLIEVVLNDGPLIIQSAEEAAAYANEQGDYALQVGMDNETRYLNAVSTVALRDSTYPTPSHGDTVRVTGTSTSYRYVLGTGWVVTDVYNSTAIDNLNQQLAETAHISNQVDYVKLLQEHNEIASKLHAKVLGDRHIEVLIPFKGKKCAHYTFKKDIKDDYIKHDEGAVSEIGLVESPKSSKNYDSNTGTWVTTAPPNYYTAQVGATFTFSFTGRGFDFRHYADNRGGVWEFVINGVTANPIRISTYNASFINPKVQSVIKGLPYGTHTAVATFKGDDPLFVPSGGVGTSRGWASFNNGSYTDKETIIVYDLQDNPVKKFDILVPLSNKEFAIMVRPTGTLLDYKYLPEHTNVGTVFAVSQKIFFDDIEITNWKMDSTIRDVKSVKIIQKMLGKHPDDINNPVAEILSIHTISATGVSYKVKFKWLRNVDIYDGYAMMIPFYNSFGKLVISSLGNRYATTKTAGFTNILDDDKAGSFAVINTGGVNGEPDIMLGMTVQNIEKTFRYGKSGKRNGTLSWIEHRNETMQKMYFNVFEETTAIVGETYEAGGTFFIGEFPMANEMLS